MSDEQKRYPDREECLRILKEHGCSDKVITHILTVTELVLKIARRFPEVDLALVEAGGLLHDLGRSKSHGIDHAVQGAKLASEIDLPQELVDIIERHIAAGIPQDVAVALGLPPKDYTPRTLEERIVAHADNLVEDNRRCSIHRSVRIMQNKGLPEAAKRILELHKALSKAAGIDLDKV